MSKDISISIQNLSKMYKLYQDQMSQIIDLFGLHYGKKKYEEFWALRDINLEVKKGSKLGIIGRNGAGKSTLLKIIASNIKQTIGTCRVEGTISTLLELGVGFHPEFTGTENIYASLAYQGIVGKEAAEKYGEIAEFTELDEFLSKPLKTYSAGMNTRLGFAVATSIEPEILIVDEVLGAGDAYFVSKCVERVQSLVEDHGTTLLFVSHDLASLQRFCDKAIWINKGKIIAEGETLNILKEYGAYVRRKEEVRLNAKNLGVTKRDIAVFDAKLKQITVRLITTDGKAPTIGLPVSRITLYLSDKAFSIIHVGNLMDSDQDEQSHIVEHTGFINWGEPSAVKGCRVREFKNMNGCYHHAVAVFKVPQHVDISQISFELEFFDFGTETICFDIYSENEKTYKTLETIQLKNSQNKQTIKTEKISNKIKLNPETEKNIIDVSSKKEVDVFGLGGVEVNEVYLTTASGKNTYIFQEGDNASLFIDITFTKQLEDFPYISYTLYDAKGYNISNFYEQITVKNKGKHLLKLSLNSFSLLMKGNYVFTIALYKNIDIYNVNKPWPAYIVLDRKLEIKITSDIEMSWTKGLLEMDSKVTIIQNEC